MANETTPARVAETATITADLPVRGLLLLGTFGADEHPQALVRLPDGSTRNVAPGDTLDGRRVLAIGAGRLALERGGAAIWIDVPG